MQGLEALEIVVPATVAGLMIALVHSSVHSVIPERISTIWGSTRGGESDALIHHAVCRRPEKS